MKRFITLSSMALAVALLSGCMGNYGNDQARGYIPEMPDERYPIEVVKGSVKLRLPVVKGRLSPSERIAVQRLADQASSLTTPVVITRPARSVKAEIMAAEISRELIARGVDRQRIVHRTSGNAGEVSISFSRKFAVTKECGDWSEPITHTAYNRPYRNFGCAHQHNLAAQVDNPEDFERPRVMTPPDADARSRAMGRYRKGEDTSSSWPRAGVNINESLKSAAKN